MISGTSPLIKYISLICCFFAATPPALAKPLLLIPLSLHQSFQRVFYFYRLARNIKKTQKRANALKNITIPTYENLTKNITNALEEKDREEFTRLKVIKSWKDA